MKITSRKVATLALLHASQAYAQVARTCPAADSGICYSLNIPDESASSGTGDIFFSIEAPSATHEWVALGQGNRMAGANIFVLYLNADGTNITISPRLGVGYAEPQVHDVELELLEGSGVTNGTMTANVRCANCHTWEGGSMDFSTNNATWIYATKAGPAIQSDALDAEISFHDDHGGFNWDFASARGGNASNPFLAYANATIEAIVQSAGGGGPSDAVLIAHTIFACLAVGFVLPIGGIVIRIGGFSQAVLVHQIIQYLGLAMFIIGFGLGAYYAKEEDYWGENHAILGTVVFGLMLLQPIFGILHHMMYKKVGGRTISSYFHLTVGRTVIILGMVNGGLGLQLTGQTRAAKIGYGVVVGVMALAYFAAIIYGEIKRTKVKSAPSTSSTDSPDSNGNDKAA